MKKTMNKDDFLQIFKTGFHKLSLKKLVKIRDEQNEHGRKYEVYLGLFEFTPPYQVWSEEQIDYDFLKSLLKEFDEELSNCIVRKFTKKVYHNDKMVKKEVQKYIFDIIPANILSFRFNVKEKTMRLVVKGYCLKK